MSLIKGSTDSNPYIITGTFCNHSIEDVLKPLLLVYCASGSVSSFFSVIAIAAMVFCRLITLMTHRLILNLLLSMFCCSFSVAVQFLNLWLNVWEGKYATVCVIEAFVVQYIHFLCHAVISLDGDTPFNNDGAFSFILSQIR